MNELELESYMINDVEIRKYFKGILARDEICRTLQKGIYIINTDFSYNPGKHWIAIHHTGSKIIYFDSLAKPVMKNVIDVINYQNIPCQFSTKVLQSDTSNVCGDYCIMFCYFSSRGYSLSYFLSLFSNNQLENDKLVNLG